MKVSKFTASVIALAVSSAFAVQAADERYIINVDNNNKAAVKALAKKLGGEIKVDADGFISATFKGKSLNSVKKMMSNPVEALAAKGLKATSDINNAVFNAIEIDHPRYLMATYDDDAGDPRAQQITPYSIKQSQADQVTFNANAGMKVCVVDSGLDQHHQDFNWNNITGDNDSGTGNWNDGGSHGTHVAGTIGALDNNIGVVGMAPGVDMHIIKVFRDTDGKWGYSSDLAHAAQKCTDAGANIISMSLGGGGANATEENAFDAFTAAGGLVVAAAGNDGDNTRSYPAGYESVMMIGGNSKDNGRYESSQFPSCQATRDDCVEVTAGGLDVLSTYPMDTPTLAEINIGGQTYAASIASDSNTPPGTFSGNTYYMGTAESTDAGANGNICVIDRGNISFHDKVQNCENSGGTGAIIINNEAGTLGATLGENNSLTIPTVTALLADKAALTAGGFMSVDVTATGYNTISGTSMATPGVSGVAALVWSNHTQCTGTQIREVLKATAEDLGDAGHDVYYGYGVVKAKAASDYITEHGCSGPVASNELTNGVAKTGLAASKGQDLTYTFQVPAGATNLSFNTSGGNGGDADLYVKFGSAASSSSNDCKSESGSSTESCAIASAQEGTYHVTVSAYSTFSDVSLVASYSEGGSTPVTNTYSNTTSASITDNNTTSSSITVNDSGSSAIATVDVDITHTYSGDLLLTLVSPSGAEQVLRSYTGRSTDDIKESYNVDGFASSERNGNWTLKVHDNAGGDTGTLNSWTINFK
ncbi:S8 family serine peptidase [Thalassomonas actiniarum]|uniref:S8 family serine peptidase n=1 Tax=Thalassomonas actiniarum TaxID=485447 RepID=A0AAE9YSW0_9GAMM|nr:S8 family serine peptidase [Thalassomonas actiniarum]